MDDPFEVERVVIRPKKIIVHEEWDPLDTVYDADIALLKFEDGKINIDHDYINPICIWDSIDEPRVNEGIILGWGKGDSTKIHETIPKQTEVTIYQIEDCLPEEPGLQEIASNRTFCASNLNVSGACSGDSGGGLFIKVDGIFYIQGLLSAGAVGVFGECDISKHALYTNIQNFAGWIKQKTQGAFATSTKGDYKIC